MIKKISILLMVTFLIVTTCNPVFAEMVSIDQEKQQMENLNSKTIINEFDIIDKLEDQSETNLMALGLCEDEIDEIKSGSLKENYIMELKRLSTLPEDKLVAMGYSPNIKMLENKDIITDEDARLFAPDLALAKNLEKHEYNPSTNLTEFVVNFSFAWESRPIYCYTDKIGFGWNGEFGLDERYSLSNYLEVEYNLGGYMAYFIESYESNCAFVEFDMADDLDYVASGIGEIHLCQAGVKDTAKLAYKYAHATRNAEIGISTGGFSFTFSGAYDEYADDVLVSYL